jgi:hypothetical protein
MPGSFYLFIYLFIIIKNTNKILVCIICNRAILAIIHKRESAKFGYRQNLRTLLYFCDLLESLLSKTYGHFQNIFPQSLATLVHSFQHKNPFLKKCGNFWCFLTTENPFSMSCTGFFSLDFFFLPQKILSYELHWIFFLDFSFYHKTSFHVSCCTGFFSLDFSSCQMVEITMPMIAIHTIVIEKKEEYLRFHLWHSNYVQ